MRQVILNGRVCTGNPATAQERGVARVSRKSRVASIGWDLKVRRQAAVSWQHPAAGRWKQED